MFSVASPDKPFFHFLNNMLPEAARLEDDVLWRLQDQSYLAQKITVGDVVQPQNIAANVAVVCQQMLDYLSSIRPSLQELLPVLFLSIQSLYRNIVLDQLNYLYLEHVREEEEDFFSETAFTTHIRKLQDNFQQLCTCSGVDFSVAYQRDFVDVGLQFLLLEVHQRLDHFKQLLKKRRDILIQLKQVVNVGEVPEGKRRLPAVLGGETRVQKISRKISRSLLARAPDAEDNVEDVSELDIFLKNIAYSPQDVLDQAKSLNRKKANFLPDLIDLAIENCRALVACIDRWKKGSAADAFYPVYQWCQQLKISRTNRELRYNEALNFPNDRQFNFLRQLFLRELTPIKHRFTHHITEFSIYEKIQAEMPNASEVDRKLVLDVVTYFHLVFTTQLQQALSQQQHPTLCSLCLGLEQLHQNELLTSLKQINLDNIVGLREDEVIKEDELRGLRFFLMRLNENNRQFNFPVVMLETTASFLLFNLYRVLVEFESLLVEREGFFDGLKDFFNQSTVSVQRRIAKAITLQLRYFSNNSALELLPAIEQSIQECIRLRESIRQFAETLGELPCYQIIDRLITFRKTFMQKTYPMDTTIFETLENEISFCDSDKKIMKKTKKVNELSRLLDDYTHAGFLHHFFSSLPPQVIYYMKRGKPEIITQFTYLIRDFYFPRHKQVNISKHMDALLEKLDEQHRKNLAFVKSHDRARAMRYSYILQTFLNVSKRGQFKPGVTQSMADTIGETLLHASTFLSFDDLRAALNTILLPLTEAELAMVFFEMNGYRIVQFLAEFIQANCSVSANVSLLSCIQLFCETARVMLQTLELRHTALINNIEKTGMTGQQLVFLQQQIDAQRVMINQVLQSSVLWPTHQLPSDLHDMTHEMLCQQGRYSEALDQLDVRYAATKSEAEKEKLNDIFVDTVINLADALTLYHRVGFVSFPIDAIFNEKENPQHNDFKVKNKQDHEKLSTYIQLSLIAQETDQVSVRTNRIRRWIYVLDRFLAVGNFYGYILLYSCLQSIRFLETAFSYLSEEDRTLYERLPMPQMNFVQRFSDYMAEHSDAIAVPPLQYIFASNDSLLANAGQYKLDWVMHAKDVRHNRGAFQQFSDIYRCYIRNGEQVKQALLNMNDQNQSLVVWMQAIESTSRQDAMILENIAKNIEQQDVIRFGKMVRNTSAMSKTRVVMYDTTFTISHWPPASDRQYESIAFLKPAILSTINIKFINELSTAFLLGSAFSSVHTFMFNKQEVVNDYYEYHKMRFAIEKFISCMCRCSHVELEKNDLGVDFLEEFLRAWRRAKEEGIDAIRSLSLANNAFGMNSGSSLLRQFMETMTLEKLNIQENGFTKEDGSIDAKNIAGGIAACGSLQEIDLGGNNFGNQGMKIILKAIAAHSTIHTIRLYNCGITKSSRRIQDACTNPLLLDEPIGHSELADIALLKAVRQNTNIKQVICDGNPGIVDEVHERIKEMLMPRGQSLFTLSSATHFQCQSSLSERRKESTAQMKTSL